MHNLADCFLEELNCAVYDILTGDAALVALATGGIFDNVPQSAVYPYLSIARIDGDAFITFDDDGDSQIYSVDIYGKSLSMKTIYRIAKRVKELLSRSEDALDALGCCVLMFQYHGVVVNPNANMETQGRMITVEFEVKIL